MAKIDPAKAPMTDDPVPSENGAGGSAGSSTTVANQNLPLDTRLDIAIANQSLPLNIVKREAPDSLRRLSDALEGWKNKQDEINKKFLQSFEQIGSDLSKIHADTGNLRQTYDDMRVAQRRASARSSRRRTTVNPLPPPKES